MTQGRETKHTQQAVSGEEEARDTRWLVVSTLSKPHGPFKGGPERSGDV